jgi:iron complex transport system substrate-binding protein
MIQQKMKTKNIHYRALYILIFLAFIVLALTVQLQAREIIDMFGNKVSVSDRPQKVYSTSPAVTYMLYAIDPSMLAGLNFPVREMEKQYIRKSIQELPVLGGWFGQGGVPNSEMILKVNPEIIVTSKHNSAMNDRVDQTMKAMPMPVVNVILNNISDYPGVFLYLGRVLGREKRAEELAGYARKTLFEISSLAASVPVRKKVSVYYAEGVDGLSTECSLSLHTELISLVGGRNVHQCQTGDLYGMEKISFEQLMIYDPEVMLVMENIFYKKVFTDPLWQRIKAVRNKRVFLIPNRPFNWFDRPPSFMRLIGAKWLANLLYPEHYRINIVKETQKFLKLFFGINISPQEAEQILQQS